MSAAGSSMQVLFAQGGSAGYPGQQAASPGTAEPAVGNSGLAVLTLEARLEVGEQQRSTMINVDQCAAADFTISNYLSCIHMDLFRTSRLSARFVGLPVASTAG